MTNEEVMQLMTDMGLHDGGMENWIPDNAWYLVVNKAIEAEREACAKLVEDSWMAFSRVPNYRLDITPFPELSYVAKVIRARNN